MKKIFFLLVLLTSLNKAQQKVVEYSDLLPNFFNSYDPPVSIAILPFTYQNNQTDIDLKFFNELTSALGKKSKFIINYYKKLEQLKTSWKINDWDPKNTRLLGKLNSELDIKLVVYAIADDKSGTSFQLKIINTNNNREEFSQKYYHSENSTSISDAVILFTQNEKAIYKDAIDRGTLAVKTIPDGKFEVYIDDRYVGDTPLLKSNLQKGNYKLTIKDIKETYQTFETKITFEPISEKPVEKSFTLQPILGSLNLSITPDDADVELYNSKNNLIKMGSKINSIDSLLAGEYKLKVRKSGYIEQSFSVLIEKNIVTTKEIKLLSETSKYYNINNVICESDVARSVLLSRDGNKYLITFDVIGDTDDDFEIELYIMDKKNKDFGRKLNQITGTFGEGKFAGRNKTLVWDFEKEIKGGLDNPNLYLELRVDETGGGSWIYYALTAIAGGGAAYYFLKPKDGNSSIPQGTIPVPPTRP